MMCSDVKCQHFVGWFPSSLQRDWCTEFLFFCRKHSHWKSHTLSYRVPAPLMFTQPILSDMQVVSDSADTLHLQQRYSAHQTGSKQSLLVERSTGGFWTHSAVSWLQNACTMLRGLWREISRSLYDLFGAGLKGGGVLEMQVLACCVCIVMCVSVVVCVCVCVWWTSKFLIKIQLTQGQEIM